MIRMVEALCDTGQDDMIEAAEQCLRALLNGAIALGHLRMYPRFAAEAVHHSLRKLNVRPKGQSKQ
jgi:hypothetical protein